MRILNKLVYACCSIAFGLMALPSCEGGELYDVNAPDWISEKVDSIANSKKDPEEEVLEGMQEVMRTTPPVSGQLSPSITSCPMVRSGMECSTSTSTLPTIPIIKTSP